jgi:hypothetical protein
MFDFQDQTDKSRMHRNLRLIKEEGTVKAKVNLPGKTVVPITKINNISIFKRERETIIQKPFQVKASFGWICDD